MCREVGTFSVPSVPPLAFPILFPTPDADYCWGLKVKGWMEKSSWWLTLLYSNSCLLWWQASKCQPSCELNLSSLEITEDPTHYTIPGWIMHSLADVLQSPLRYHFLASHPIQLLGSPYSGRQPSWLTCLQDYSHLAIFHTIQLAHQEHAFLPC